MTSARLSIMCIVRKGMMSFYYRYVPFAAVQKAVERCWKWSRFGDLVSWICVKSDVHSAGSGRPQRLCLLCPMPAVEATICLIAPAFGCWCYLMETRLPSFKKEYKYNIEEEVNEHHQHRPYTWQPLQDCADVSMGRRPLLPAGCGITFQQGRRQLPFRTWNGRVSPQKLWALPWGSAQLENPQFLLDKSMPHRHGCLWPPSDPDLWHRDNEKSIWYKQYFIIIFQYNVDFALAPVPMWTLKPQW